MIQETFIAKTVEDLQHVVQYVQKNLADKNCIALKGPLGSGKTEWTRQFLRAGGNFRPVVSPTFIYYETYQFNERQCYHFDLYRITTEDEFFLIGGEEILSDEKNLCIIEWPEVIEDILPKDKTIYIEFSVQEDLSRKVVIIL